MIDPNRRTILKAGGLAMAASAPPALVKAQAARPPRLNSVSGQLFWTVETSSGRIQGIANNGIKQFKGVPYGAPTGGRNRFMPPQKPAAWTGVRDCLGFGAVSPQTPMDLAYDYAMLVYWDSHIGPGGMSEDCLNLNIWTPGVNDGAKRPVLVSFHGGGFTSGSGNASMYDGGQMARLGDVVVVTVNHRLGAFGYTHLADLGAPPELKYAGVCGMMDLVASLQWVRDNIERFGGDPNRVMIFGQSGGGSKTNTMMAMPSAKGLFHHAASQSSFGIAQPTREEATREADKVLKALGLSYRQIGDIQKVPWQRLLEAQAVSGGAFRPVVDGEIIPHQLFTPQALAISDNVPQIIGTTLHDHATRYDNFDIDDAGLLGAFRRAWKDKAPEILRAYRTEAPSESAFRLQAKAFTDANRGNVMVQASRKAARGAAPVYLYQWDWVADAYDGRYGAVHCADLDASFHLYRSPIAGSGAAVGRAMVDRIAASWVAMARSGDPNNPLIPTWRPYDATRRATMVFDQPMRLVDDYRGDFVRLIGDSGPSVTA